MVTMLVPRHCWRCGQVALLPAFARIFCDDCQRALDEVAAWRLFFWEVFDLERAPGWHARQKGAR